MPYIDAHVHVWTNDFEKYPIAPGFKPEQMKPPTFLPEDILRHGRPSGVNRVVLVQMSYYQNDNSYMLDVIRTQPEVFRGIGIVDWEGERPGEEMKELESKGVGGFRIYPGKADARTWLDTDGFAEMFRCGGEKRLALCPLVGPDALPAIGRMCERFPDTPVIIDHLARIGTSGRIEDREVEALCVLAKHKNVMVKVSAFYALGNKKAPHLDLSPLIHRVVQIFGPNRLMWASDCPYQVQNETYEDSIGLIRDRLDYLSEDDKAWILGKTAEEFFFNR